ncbi:MAG TPA: secretin N-terminal domain-containing protein [bacterium]|nr:secretin N-terminal domain-containing protein [bacterium]
MLIRASGMRVTVISLVVALLVLPSLRAPSVLASPLRVIQVTVKDLDNRLVVGIMATGQILFNVTEISTPRPPRVAIDILNAVADERIRGTSEVNKGNVLRVRVGQFQDSPAIARIVVDLAHPVRVQVHLASPTVLTVSLPLQQTAEAEAEAALPAPVPTRLGVAAPTAGAAPGTGLIRTAQPLPPPPLPGGGSGPGILRLVEFRGVALADVLTAFAKLCGFNLVTDGSIAGTITLRLLDVTCEEALRFVLETNNLGYRRLGKNLIVGSAEKLAPPPEVPETIAYRLSYGDPNQIRAAVAAAVPGVRVAIDARTNALLITGTSAQQEEVVKVLASLDVKIPQVVIQVHVVEIGTSYVKTLGLFGGQGGAAGAPGTFGTVAVDSANNRLTFTLQSTTLFFFQLQALVNEGKARVVTAPRVATLDGNKATIILGQKVPIFTSVTVGGQLQTTVTYQDVGVQLETTPRVNSDNMITLSLKPQVSSLGAPQSSGGQTAFIINTRTADTQLSVQDGKTIVLGGLISRDERLTTIKVPVLGDIPILGELFKNTSNTITESELIFLITPQIVKD